LRWQRRVAWEHARTDDHCHRVRRARNDNGDADLDDAVPGRHAGRFTRRRVRIVAGYGGERCGTTAGDARRPRCY
jgi:hypothetical protein